MFKRFVVGDIHGRISALNEVLDKAGFDNETDQLITMGDIVDGGEFTRQVVDRLLEIKNRIDIRGNHDQWFMEWMDSDPRKRFVNRLWQEQGGYATQRSYGNDVTKIPYCHKKFFRDQVIYYVDKKNRIFVHGGFNPLLRIEFQDAEFLLWDRVIIEHAKCMVIPGYSKVFVGHTQVGGEDPVPQFYNNLVMTDCGAGWMGRLALISVEDPHEYYLSQKQTSPDR